MDTESLTSTRPWKRRRLLDMLPSKSSLSDLLSSFGAHKSPVSASRMRLEEEMKQSTQQTLHGYSRSQAFPSTQTENGTSNPGGGQATVSAAGVDPDDIDELQDDDDVIHVVSRSFARPADVVPKRSSTRLLSTSLRTPKPQTAGVKQQVRGAQAHRTLPARSTRAVVKYDFSKRLPATSPRVNSRLLVSDTSVTPSKAKSDRKPVVETARNKVRSDIAEHTKPKRDAFLLTNKEDFYPLLPENNYVRKLERLAAVGGKQNSNVIVPHDFKIDQPSGVLAVMKPYQLEGLSFLLHMYRNGMSAILGDEMGLGKTLQTLSMFQWLAENKPTDGETRPHLVVCPLSVLSSWIAECRKWVPSLNVIRFHGPKGERERLKQTCLDMKQRHDASQRRKSSSKASADGRIDVVITTYETFVAEQGWFKRVFVWKYCVLDEGHKIKNDSTDISAALQSLSAEYRLLLTGTPLQNNLHEMWALLHWLIPEVFTSETAIQFKQAFNLTNGTVSTAFMDSARRLLELIMLRRMKSSPGINLGLPPKEEVLLYVPLTPMQRFWYTRLLTRTDNGTLDDLFKNTRAKEQNALDDQDEDDKQLALLEEAGERLDQMETTNLDIWAQSKAIMEEAVRSEEPEKTGSWQKLMNLLMQLRKTCIHPYMMRNAAPDEYEIGEHLKIASSKFIVLDRLIDELVIKKRKKILVFSGFTSALNLVEELLAWKGGNDARGSFRFARLDGRTARAQRNLSIRLFNDTSSDVRVMLLSTRAGGLGINLTSATEVVFMDEDWNPQVTLQAEARAHRIGQTQKVTIYKLCTQGTVEEQMMGRIRKKLYLSAKITESMRNIHTANAPSKKRKRESTSTDHDDTPQLNTASLQSLIRRGAQTLARPEIDVAEMLDWSWETILEKCKDRPADALIDSGDEQSAQHAEQTWLNTMERVETAVFEGRAHQKALKESAARLALPEGVTRADRRIDKNTTVMVDGFAVAKESLLCDDWEAVPTLAGKDARLASSPREKKPPIQHETHCQVCWRRCGDSSGSSSSSSKNNNNADVLPCSACPRTYHTACLDAPSARRSHNAMFYCPQHQCRDCGAKTSEAGGLIFRCRWCERGFCEDCLDWDTARLVGPALPELEMCGYHRNALAYYVECAPCVQRWVRDRKSAALVERVRAQVAEKHARWLESEVVDDDQGQGQGQAVTKGVSARVPALTAADTPATVSEVATPTVEEPRAHLSSSARMAKGRASAQ